MDLGEQSIPAQLCQVPRVATVGLHTVAGLTQDERRGDVAYLCYQKMSSARMSRGETLVLVMQPARDRPTHDLALAPGR